MNTVRDYLPGGTKIQFKSGNTYEIVGQPIGAGGGSIIYPAQRLVGSARDGIVYALKECFPISAEHPCRRDSHKDVVPENPHDEYYLAAVRRMQLAERESSQKIYLKGNRLLPILEAAEGVTLALPDGESHEIYNAFTVMESLSGKGRSLNSYVEEQHSLAPLETFRVVQQVLFALREVHQAGFLHLDIQGGNIFIKGALEDGSDIATLIDFGCARPMTDGKTAPIADRIILSTQGFTAPEILYKNDGTLQLTPQADIYSVGCLMLYLLTGRRYDANTLMNNKSGKHLTRMKLRNISCPKHLVDRMQEIIARAVETDTDKRYQSVDEMLEDVTGFIKALQPYHGELEEMRYEAFICYRHSQRDTKAAMFLQQQLEHLKVPKGVVPRRRTGWHIFVDNGELSSCADFGEQIRLALKNAKWLIVVCSTDTPQSPWVELEIKTFLEYHDASRILAVLTDGEPETAFPEILRSSREVDILAADARGNKGEMLRKLRGDALLKLAAPMLNTTFDTLKQRQKVYKLQRMMAGAAVFIAAALSFAGYAVNRGNLIARQAQTIEEEYRSTLINESRFLVEQAQKRLDNQDKLGAIELALRALPTETLDRPVLTEAEYVLSKALGAYVTPTYAEDTVSAVGIITSDVSDFILDDSGKILITYKNYPKKIQAWDTDTMSLKWECPLTGDDIKPVMADGGRIIASSKNMLLCFDAESGEKLWNRQIEDISKFAVTEDGKGIIVIAGGRSYSDEAASYNVRVIALSAEDGEIIRTTEIPIEGSHRVFSSSALCASDDLKWAAVVTTDIRPLEQFAFAGIDTVHLVNLETGAVERKPGAESGVISMKFVLNKLAVIRNTGTDVTMKTHNSVCENDYPHNIMLEVYDMQTSEKKWNYEIDTYLESRGIDAVLNMDYNTGDGIYRNGLVYIFGNHCVLADSESFEIKRHYILPDAVTSMEAVKNGLDFTAANGTFLSIRFRHEVIIKLQYWNRPIITSQQHGDVFIVKHGKTFNKDNALYKYQRNCYDSSYKHLAEANIGRFASSMFFENRQLIILNDEKILWYNLDNSELLTIDYPEEHDLRYNNIFTDPSTPGTIYWREYNPLGNEACWLNRRYFSLCFDTGIVEELNYPSKPNEKMKVEDSIFADGKIYIAATFWEDDNYYLLIYKWNLETGNLNEIYRYELGDTSGTDQAYIFEAYNAFSMCFDKEKRQITFETVTTARSPMALFCLNVDNDKIARTTISVGAPADGDYFKWNYKACVWNKNATKAVLMLDKKLYVADMAGNTLCVITIQEDVTISAMHFSQDESCLFILDDEGTLYEYRISDGECLAQLKLGEDESLYMGDVVTWRYMDDSTLLICTKSHDAFLLDVSDGTIKHKARISQCVAYDSENNQFISVEDYSHSDDKTYIGAFPYYSVDDLIQMGRQTIGTDKQ